MASNGEIEAEDNEVTENNGDKVVTMMDVLKEQEDFEEDANAVLGASDDKNCTYALGYIKRQAIYACMTCCSEAKEDPSKRAGVCLACSLTCHENHELIELYTKRNFRCDCGNPKFNSHPCQFTSDKTDLNEDNSYNQNFSGLYCVCHRPYPDPEATEEDEMIQCVICEDWLHASHLEATIPTTQYAEMICKGCMDKNEFLHNYSDLAINTENDFIDIMNTSDVNIEVSNGDNKNETMDTTTSEVDQSNTDAEMPQVHESNSEGGLENSENSEFNTVENREDSDIKQNMDAEISKDSTLEKPNDINIDNKDTIKGIESEMSGDTNGEESNTENRQADAKESEKVLDEVSKTAESADENIDSHIKALKEIVEASEDSVADETVNQDIASPRNNTVSETENLVETENADNESENKSTNVEETNKEMNVQETNREISVEGTNKEINVEGTNKEMNIEETSIEMNVEGTNTEINDEGANKEMNIEGTNKEINDEGANKEMNVEETVKEMNNEGTNKEMNVEETNKEIIVEETNKEMSVEKTNRQMNVEEIGGNSNTHSEKTESKNEEQNDSKNSENADENPKANENQIIALPNGKTETQTANDEDKIELPKSAEELEKMDEDRLLADPDESLKNESKEENIEQLPKDNTDEKPVDDNILEKESSNSELISSDSGPSDTTLKASAIETSTISESDTQNIETSDENVIQESIQSSSDENNIIDASNAEETEHDSNKAPMEASSDIKRKLPADDSDSEIKKRKIDSIECTKPKECKRKYKGATFWPSHYRQKLCTCNECLSMYKDLSVLFLLDQEDTVSAYENLGKEKTNGKPSQYEKGLQALSSLDRIQQINVLTEYNKMRDKFLDFLKSFKDRRKVVTEEDVKAFFAGMKPKRRPDGVYFCR